MANTLAQAREDQFLGGLLGLAIGDAMGHPLRGMGAEAIADRYGRVEGYISHELEEHDRSVQGEISDKSEIVLCLVESLTTNDGLIDPVNINARLGFLANGPSRQWMSDATADGIALASDHDGIVPDDYVPSPELAVAVRAIPVGLLHAVGGFDERILEEEAETVSRLTHAGPQQARLTAEVARVIANAARTREIIDIPEGIDDSGERHILRSVLDVVRTADSFLPGVSEVIGLGGPTDSIGALAGGIAGTRVGASGIPQGLIDDLDARIYLSLAAPWFYRTAMRRAGTIIDLRLIQ